MDYATYKANINKRNITLISKLGNSDVPKKVSFDNYELIVNPGVFDPSLGEGSRIMAKIKHLFVGENVLEIGTGTGALSILAAEKSKKVIATDISEEAILCAKENVSKYNLKKKIELRQGDLFSPINDKEKFDIIIFNPPFLEGKPTSNLECSYFDQEYITLEKFFNKVSNYLTPQGVIYLCFGSVGDVAYLTYLITYNKFIYFTVKADIINQLEFYVLKINKRIQ